MENDQFILKTSFAIALCQLAVKEQIMFEKKKGEELEEEQTVQEY